MDELVVVYLCVVWRPGQRGGKRHLSSLSLKVNKAIASFPGVISPVAASHRKVNKPRQPSDNLAARVSSKLQDRDIRCAIRLAASEDSIAPFDEITAEALRSKHPARSTSDSPLPPPSNYTGMCINESELLRAI
jgi:hypothetical protein